MYEFLSQNQMYVVLCVTLLSWGGVAWYLFQLERKISAVEKSLKKD